MLGGDALCMVMDAIPARGGPSGPLHLSLVTETWAPEVNGVAMTLGRLVEGLRSRGHRVSLVRPRQAHEHAKSAPRDTHLCTGIPIPLYRALRFGLAGASTLKRLWRGTRPDLVHVATEGPVGHAALGAARALGVPVSSSFHTNFHDYASRYGVGWIARPCEVVLRRFHNRTGITLVPSPTMKARLEARRFERCEVLARGVDTQQFSPVRRDAALREAWGAGPRTKVLLCVGRLAKENNLDLAVRTFRYVQRKHPSTRLVLVGAGPLEHRLVREPGVVLAGEFPVDEVGVAFASADLFLFPSLTETFGNVLCEAMATRLPTVSFDYAASAMHVRDGANGRKVPCGHEDAFMRAACDLLDDAGHASQLGKAARASMQRTGWSGIVDQFEKVATSLVGRYGGSSA